MDKISDVDSYKKLELNQIREKVKFIRDELPDEKKKVITYSKNFTLSLSNYCINLCGYCYYNYKIPKLNGNVILLNNDEIDALTRQAIQFKCKEALIMSGECPGSFMEVKKELKKLKFPNFLEYVKQICTYLLNFNILPHTNIGFLTYDEMKELKRYNASMGLMLESTSMNLFNKGNVHEFSPGKLPTKRIEHISNAGKLKIPFTTGLLLGIGETFEEVISDLHLIKEMHTKYGHIQEIILQNFVQKNGIPYQPRKPFSFQEMLKITGIARIILENEVSIQIPPNLVVGFEKEFIDMGIDDFGGISPITLDQINPENQWPQIKNLHKICRDNGYKLKERLPIYDRFIIKGEFSSENIKKVINNINLND